MAQNSLVQIFRAALTKFDVAIASILARRPPPDEFCFALADVSPPIQTTPSTPSFSLKDILGEGFLWAVPRSRRTLEKRMKRKFGTPGQHEKILRPKGNLIECNTCGDDHTIGTLCGTCYKRVMDETKSMQERIQDELKLEPVENEVVVVYAGEKDEKPAEFWHGKRVVEMCRDRPQWFSRNLLQQTTQKADSDAKDVKPSDLG